MSVHAGQIETPATREAFAAALAGYSEQGLRVRLRGAGTKLAWGNAVPDPDVELSTTGLDRLVEHNAGDLTAIVEAGVRLDHAQHIFAEAGQMLALDPPGGDATIGGVIATGDSGPLRHRHGAARDLVLGIAIALPSGEIVRAGGKVIKNVAGYDLGKLFSGSFGTLGAIIEVALRLHPLPHEACTVVAPADDPRALAAAALTASHAPVEAQALDLAWHGGSGKLLVRCVGRTAHEQAVQVQRMLDGAEIIEDDAELWERQRSGQRSASRCVVRVSGLQRDLARVIEAAERHGGGLVARAALGVSWLTVDGDAVAALRQELSPYPCVLLDAPEDVRAALDPWGPAPAVDLMRRVKARFDPAGTLNPGIFVGGI